MAAKPLIEPVCSLRHTKNAILDSKASRFTLRNNNTESCLAEIILDYKQCEGGIPVFEVASALGDIPISIAVVYSEGVEGIEHSTGRHHIPDSSPISANIPQAMDPFSSFLMLWTHTEAPP